MAAQQPNFGNAAHYLHALAGEVNLIPNIPAIQQGDQVLGVLQQIQAGIQQIQTDVQQAIADIQQVDFHLQEVERLLQTLNDQRGW